MEYSKVFSVISFSENTIYWVLVYAQSCPTITKINFRTMQNFRILQEKPYTPQLSFHCPLISHPLETITLLSVPVILLALDISCKWNYIIHGLLQLAPSNGRCSERQPCYMNPHCSSSLPVYILLDGQAMSFLPIQQLMHIVSAF